MKSSIQAVRGTRDFYPDDMALRTWLYSCVRNVSESFGYQEYEGPFLESIDLYAAKSGEELVKEQSYVFPDRGGELITLRPELTPTLARMVAKRQKQLVYPLRWWSFGPFWRYERPAKGRSREFFQWNIDLIGVNTPEADAEMVAIIATLFEQVGLNPHQVQILVNSRELMDEELRALGIPDKEHPTIFRLIDRRDKMTEGEWEAYASELGLEHPKIIGIVALLSNYELWKKHDKLVKLFKAAEALGVGRYVSFNPGIIRGLNYYTGTVFEAQEMEGEIRRSILGGGRYDNLLEDVGGEALPAVGFAMGDMVINLILEKHGLLPKEILLPSTQVLVTVFDDSTLLSSYNLATRLRHSGINAITYPEAAKLAKQLKFADRIKVRLVLILGTEELTNNQVTLKDLASSQQQLIPLDSAVEVIKDILAGE